MTIKQTAGKMLLYFYRLQRTAPSGMTYHQLAFIDQAKNKLAVTSDKTWMTRDLLDIAPVTTDLLNAFIYLREKGFVHSNMRASKGKRIYVGIQLTGAGIDIIEGIEYGSSGKTDFGKTFNISVSGDTKVDDVIEDQIGRLLKDDD